MATNRWFTGLLFALLPIAWGCNASDQGKDSSTGGQSSGSENEGGQTSATGGSTATGGRSSSAIEGTSSSAIGGTATGGTAATGGTSATGGSKATGGTSATGGSKATGGTSATGGSKATGGTSATGGSKATGGTSATGGSKATGGTSATGGSKATGGTSATGGSTGAVVYGEVHSGQFHLGPVDFTESAWTNACSPYPSSLYPATGLGGEYVVGVSNTYSLNGGSCDACIYVSTGAGRQIVARVITFGVTNEPGDIDVSPSVYAALNTGEYPRNMTWQFAKCPDTGTLRYQFQTEANADWTSFWVRNPRVPVTKVEVKSTKHAAFVALTLGTDGTVTDSSGFGSGAFTLRVTGMDGQVITDTFSTFSPGQIITSTTQFE